MRSKTITILLTAIATILIGAMATHLTSGNLNRILGAPPIQTDQLLYPNINPADINIISLRTNGAHAVFERINGEWLITKPIRDRMDPRYAKLLIDFTLTTRVADIIPNTPIASTQSGLQDGMIRVHLRKNSNDPITTYTIGKKTAWLHLDTSLQKELHTCFIQPHDRTHRNKHTYACTIPQPNFLTIFAEGFRYFRDHHPFTPSAQPVTIQIKNPSSTFTLHQPNPQSPWLITKPQHITTDPEKIKNLLENLYRLSAQNITTKDQTPLPTDDPKQTQQITITDTTGKTSTLTLTPSPTTPTTILATVSDRPNTIFEIPRDTQNGITGLSSLNLTQGINELRSRNQTYIDIRQLKTLTLIPHTFPPIQLIKPRPDAWHIKITQNFSLPVNEQTLYKLLKLLTETKATNFLTDNATPENLITYGQTTPALTIIPQYNNGQTIPLHIGIATNDTITAILDTPNTKKTIIQLPHNFLTKIPLHFNDWRDTTLLSIQSLDLKRITRIITNKPTLTAEYDDLNERWTTFTDGKKDTRDINPIKTRQLLTRLANLRVHQWLDPQDKNALTALQNPALTMTIDTLTTPTDGSFDLIPETHTLHLTPTPSGSHFYGRLSTQTSLFLLDRPSALDLATDIHTH